MTIEELLKCSADDLRAMSDAEILEHFADCLIVTRPELAAAAAEYDSGIDGDTLYRPRDNRQQTEASMKRREKAKKMATLEAILKQHNLKI